MALGKLWNAVFGKRAEKPAASVPAAAEKPSVVGREVATSPASGSPVAGSAKTAVKLSRQKTKAAIEKPIKAVEPVATVTPPVTVRMFRRKNNSWTKLIGSRTIQSILDLNVGDGSRTVDLLSAIVDSSTPAPKYIAVGLFELAGEKLTVRQFHQKVRSSGGQPVAIPMELTNGLRHLSQTVGTVDLILLDGSDSRTSDPAVARLLQRVTHPNSLVLRCDSAGRWQAAVAQSRKAA